MAETQQESVLDSGETSEELIAEHIEVPVKSNDVFKVPTILPTHAPVKFLKVNLKTKEQSHSSKEISTETVAGDSSVKIPESIDKSKNKENIPLPYKKPKWSGIPNKNYSFEVIKNGVVVENIDLSKRPYTVCGRLANCDIVMEHPSISRYHAIIQYRCVEEGKNPQSEGFYLFDLDSTHGTQVNKNAVKPRIYYRLHVGHMIKFGGSSRNYVLQGPVEDEEEESPLTITEIKEKRLQEELYKKKEEEENAKKVQEENEAGVDWGMGEDAEEEEESSDINPFAIDNDNAIDNTYFDDPKKTLRGWFEREGYDLQYNVEEIGQAHFLCKVSLPLDSASGQPVIAEAKVKGKKKEAVIACALEACRILDKHSVLRQAAKSRQVATKNWEDDDYYDSDEDTFLDRTGTIEKKRMQRIRKSGKADDVVETYDSLLEKHKKIVEEISDLEITLHETKKREETENEDEDSLEAYMKSINNNKSLDKSVKSNLKLKIAQLNAEEKKLTRLIKITKPVNLPPLVLPTSESKPKVSSPTFKVESPILQTSPLKITLVLKAVELPVTNHLPEVPTVVEQTESTVIEETNSDPKTTDVSSSVKNSKNISESENTKEIEQEKATVNPPAHKAEKRKESQDKKVNKKAKLNYEYDESNPDYHMWMPPDDQSGDGKTKLNEKFGY